MNPLSSPKLIAVAALVAAGGIWWLSRRGVAQDLGAGAVRVAEGVAVGAVEGLGSVVGIPKTNTSQCAADQAAGRWWDASFSCPAGTFIVGLTKTGGSVSGAHMEMWGAEARLNRTPAASAAGNFYVDPFAYSP